MGVASVGELVVEADHDDGALRCVRTVGAFGGTEIVVEPHGAGSDGQQWVLDARSCAAVARHVAGWVRAGRLRDGTRWSESRDAGWTQLQWSARLCVGEPDGWGATTWVPVDARWAGAQPVATWVVRFRVVVSDRGSIGVDAARAAGAAEAAAVRCRLAARDRRAVWGSAGGIGEQWGSGLRWAGARGVHLEAIRRVLVVDDGGVPLRVLHAACGAGADRRGWAAGVCAAASRALGAEAIDASSAAGLLADDDATVLAAIAGGTDAVDDPVDDPVRTEQLATVLAAAYSTVLLADVVGAEVLDAGAGWVLSVVDPERARRRWQRRAVVGQVLSVAVGGSETDAVWSGCAALAHHGHGAPLPWRGSPIAWAECALAMDGRGWRFRTVGDTAAR